MIDKLTQVQAGAACRGADLDIFFPEDDTEPGAADAALEYCTDCPVRVRCLDYALEHEAFGIFGGTTARQRRNVRRLRNMLMCDQCGSVQTRKNGTNIVCSECKAHIVNTSRTP